MKIMNAVMLYLIRSYSKQNEKLVFLGKHLDVEEEWEMEVRSCRCWWIDGEERFEQKVLSIQRFYLSLT